MSLLSSLLGGCVGCIVAPVEVTEPAATAVSPAAPQGPVAPAEPVALPEPAAPTIPSPAALRPTLLHPAGLGPAPPPMALRPTPTIVAAPPRSASTHVSTHHSRVPRGWAVDMSAGTSVPISAGAALQVESPPRILGQLELGGLPSGYVDLLNVLARGGGSPAGSLARGAGRRAFVIRAAVGVRPLKRRGLELRAGYTGALLGQDVTTLSTIAAAADTELADVDRDVIVQSTLHNIHAEAGWRWLIRGHFLVRAAVGYVHSLGARLSLSPDPKASSEEVRRTDLALGQIADAAAFTAVRSPLLTLHLGYRF